MGLRRRIGALGAGLLTAALPLAVHAAEAGGRALARPAGSTTAILATLGAIGALLLVSALGYLYERQRGLEWDFQRPDAVVEHH